MADVELEKAKLELENNEEVQSTEKIAGAKIGSEASQSNKQKETLKKLMEGTKLGMPSNADKEQDFALRCKRI